MLETKSSAILEPTAENIAAACHKLAQGELVAFSTETVYGLGAAAHLDKAVAHLFEVKGRPQFNPLICHLFDAMMATHYVQWNDKAEHLARKFWPGPLTLVLPRKSDAPVSLLASAGLDTLAIRSPAHPVARALLEGCGFGIVAPSANRSGRVSPTRAEHVKEELGDAISMILDGGACDLGIESTVIDVTSDIPVLLRPGSITKEDIEKCVGEIRLGLSDEAIQSPGMLPSHYAPSLPVRLNVTDPRINEALIAFGKDVPEKAVSVVNLSEAGDLREAAANLFAALRFLDKPEYAGIAVMPIPNEGIGIAINDRLMRAAKGSART